MTGNGYTLDEPLLTLKDVNLTLGEGDKARLILRDVEMQILNIKRAGLRQGQVSGLLGPSGIGKTQLFKIISGFLEPDSGTVLVGVEQKPPKPGRVGVVSQNYRVFRDMTVFDNLTFAGRRAGMSAADAKAKADDYLHRFNLDARKTLWPEQLSGGQRQRVAILQQVMAGHDFICMDEPFSGLDVNQSEEVVKLIRELVSDDELRTFIVVTHDIGAAISISDTLWLMGLRHDDATDSYVEGARILEQYSLMKMGLAWDPDIRLKPDFMNLQRQVIERFRTLLPPR